MSDPEPTLQPPETQPDGGPPQGPKLPLAAIVALVAFALGGVVMFVLAGISLLSESGEAQAQAPTLTATRPVVTSVPTFIPTDTPIPSDTPTSTPTETPSPTPSPSTSPPAGGSERGTPSGAPSRTATRRPATGGGSAASPPTSPPVGSEGGAPTQPPASASGGGSHGVTGQLQLCNPKSSYAAKSDTFIGERICVFEMITNNTDQTITYGVLGVQATNTSGGANFFQTSWRGDLSVAPHANGPTGGGWEDGLYLTAGSYALTLSICYSSVDTCLGGGGDWETLTGGIPITVVNWTP